MAGKGKPKTGGRQKGTPNGRTRARKELIVAAAVEGITPLEVMLKAMRHYDAAGERDKAAAVAKDAAPYMHPRLASIDHSVKGSVELEIVEKIRDANDHKDGGTAPTTAAVLPQ